MVGKLTFLVSATLLLAGGFSPAGAQAPADPQAPPAPPPMRRPGGFGGGERHRPNATPEEMEKFKNVRKALDELTPEQRQRFQENFLRWSNLSPEEKKALTDRYAFRRKKIDEDIDAAIKEAGLELDAQRRELFARRYGEERQRIEEQIRREMDAKRRPLLKEVIAKLKAEFAPVAVPGRPSGVPAPPVP